MDDKNELNDLLLGNQKESSSSKKFFLIAAGVLLLFFIIIGIMKFVGANETKQPLPITSQEQIKKQLPQTSPSVSTANNATTADTNAAAGADDKLNAIVKKLQQDAQKEASAQPLTPPAVEQKTVATTPVQKPQTAPVVVKTTPTPTSTPVAVKSVAVPVKTAQVSAEPKVLKQAEPAKKEDVKAAFKEATKNTVKPKPVAKPAVAKKAEPKAEAAASGAYYIQVGYFESEKSIGALGEKVTKAGFATKTKQAVKNDKNITKVLVGPFNSKEDAQKALPKAREQIKNDAFIIKG